MKDYGVFDVLGPIMIGPSSSHTAGAARLGKVARAISGGEIESVKFYLHGSFAKTYKGHGTDRALVAGILGMDPSDERLRDSLDIAKENGIKVEFIPTDFGNAHPNTVKIVMDTRDEGRCEVVGSSIGGGNIQINEVNGQHVVFTGAYPTLIVSHKDVPGVVSKVTALLYELKINIAFMNVFRSQKGKSATMVFQCDNKIHSNLTDAIKEIDEVQNIISINPITEDE